MPNLVLSEPRLTMPAELVGELAAQKWRILCDVTFPNAKSAASIALAFDYCKARNLDVFKKPVHIVPMWSSTANDGRGAMVETIWPGINEVQTTAARTGQYAGMDPPEWGPEISRVFTETDKNGKVTGEIELFFPEWCSVTVYRMLGGQRCPFTEPVYWLETYSTKSKFTDMPNAMWMRRVRGQLHKCAKAASLRAAFPEELGNEYTADEMEGKELHEGFKARAVIEGESEPVADDAQTAAEPTEETPPEPKHRLITVRDGRGKPWATVPNLQEGLAIYKEVKDAASDKVAVAVQNLELLRDAHERAKNGLRDKLAQEIAAAEAHAAQGQAEMLEDA